MMLSIELDIINILFLAEAFPVRYRNGRLKDRKSALLCVCARASVSQRLLLQSGR